MLKHTSGPWEAGHNDKGGYSNSMVVRPKGEFPHGLWIADCGCGDDESRANARLIAAAPDLLKVLQEIWADDNNRQWLASKHGAAIRAALSSATSTVSEG
ncbi:hypothetical protein TSH7_25070 [Azospirillum sp. TSH7]|uniref:hypothetical protein n=1 Tax=unclassified Azospirillum TaxID=2630922 RepID=UPI000D617FF2|nr:MULTISPECIES: hypothetical protein [unclassified Azospirillum]PWC57820.1 hypothetical protein TSH7_25070 [Azospirillum sp. TSH7]PWC70239.1 hypothetical protein TSH20_07110 [Azospirillum sp. TSH20]